MELEFRHAPKIKILDTWYGPYEEEEATLPLEAALFFLCKQGAQSKKMRTRYTRLHTGMGKRD